ncbi:MAG TPA: aldehyde dehydrogenase family protein [Stellaceae bacterium]|nr:aldehyde dehydrogenase family protein [Stellaceae bacterium]
MTLMQQIEAGRGPATRFTAREHKMLIDGAWLSAASGAVMDVSNPATGEVFAQVPAGGAEDIHLAVEAARRAFEDGPWPAFTGPERARLLWNLADLIESCLDEISFIETVDMGMPFKAARMGSIGSSPGIARYLSGWAGRLYGDTIPPSAGNWHIYTVREPCGVAGIILPWNVPFGMAVSQICAALAAGCSIVLKPAEQTSLSTLRLGELIQEAGVPKGVVNIVTGYGREAGAALAAHPGVNKLSFTGSTATGKSILAASVGSLKRVSLELGGKSPVIILPDADLDQAIPGVARGIFSNSGQVCVAGSRLFVHPKVEDQVLAGLAIEAERLKVGPGLDPVNDLGPLVSNAQLERVLGYIEAGRKSGAVVIHGGERLGDRGYFVQPTVFTNAHRDMSVVRDEIFGPVLSVIPMDDDSLENLARLANDTDYGLAANIWTSDIKAAHKLAQKIRAGSIRINTSGNVDPAVPFGGYKQSGLGRERGREGVEMYTELKTVLVAL